MRGFALTAQEVRCLRIAHRACRDRRLADRIKAVVLLGTGWTRADVAEALLLDEDTLHRYVALYQEEGMDGLLMLRYQGSQPKLTPEQLQQLDQHLQEHLYGRIQDIVAYVEAEFGVLYSIPGMTDVLARLDYVYKKPKRLPGKHPDLQTQLAFQAQYEALKASKGKDDPIYFMDGTHPQHNSVAAYGWIKRGTEKTLESNTGRKRVNLNGAIDIERLEVVTEFGEAVNAQSTLALFKQIESRHPRATRIYIVCDNARYYRCRLVTDYLRGSKIALIFLPPYCPNLNLIERLWKYFRKQILYNKYYERFADFEAACRSFFGRIKEHAAALRTLLAENFQTVGA